MGIRVDVKCEFVAGSTVCKPDECPVAECCEERQNHQSKRALELGDGTTVGEGRSGSLRPSLEKTRRQGHAGTYTIPTFFPW